MRLGSVVRKPIGGEVSGETGTGSPAESNAVLVKGAGSFCGRVPENWRERFITAYDDGIRAWIWAAAAGGATGPSAWDGYAATVPDWRRSGADRFAMLRLAPKFLRLGRPPVGDDLAGLGRD